MYSLIGNQDSLSLIAYLMCYSLLSYTSIIIYYSSNSNKILLSYPTIGIFEARVSLYITYLLRILLVVVLSTIIVVGIPSIAYTLICSNCCSNNREIEPLLFSISGSNNCFS